MGVGAQLRRARESRGLTVRDVADSTKIPTRQIDAIESEHYEKLPGGIFGRGYVRAVAEALRLDADAIVSAYRDETEPERSAVPAAPAAQGGEHGVRPPQSAQHVSMAWRLEQSEPRIRMAPADVVSTRGNPSKWLAAVLIGLGAILLILWLGRDHSATPLSEGPPAVAPQERQEGARLAGETPATRLPDVPPRALPQPAAAPDQPVGTVGESAAKAAAAAQPATQAGKPTELLIVAERQSWLVLNVDGTRIARRRLQPRETVRVQMRERATVHTGDAGALKLSLNGGAFTPLGPSGSVRTVEITPPRP